MPPRIHSPSPQRILDAHHDHPRVSESGVQRGVRTGRSALTRRSVEDPAGARRREVPDDHSQDHHALQPAAYLPAAQPRVFHFGRRLRGVDDRHAEPRDELVGAAHHARSDRVPGRPGVRADFGDALRGTPVTGRMSVDSIRARRLMAVAVVIGLLLRLAFAFGYWIDKPLTQDGREYLALARSLSAGKGLTYDAPLSSSDTPRFGRAPGYPVFLALLGGDLREFSATPPQVKIAQSIVGALGVWLIGAIARRAGGHRAGVAAAFIAAMYPPLVWICAYVFSETLFSTAALSAVL